MYCWLRHSRSIFLPLIPSFLGWHHIGVELGVSQETSSYLPTVGSYSVMVPLWLPGYGPTAPKQVGVAPEARAEFALGVGMRAQKAPPADVWAGSRVMSLEALPPRPASCISA